MSITGVFLFLIFLLIFVIAAVYLFQTGSKTGFIDGTPPPTLTQAQQQQNTSLNGGKKKEYYTYKHKKYIVKQGKLNGKYIIVDNRKIYISSKNLL